MRIEISEKGSDAFCREVVNITAQYRSILKNHNHKLKDYFRQFRLLLVLGAAVLVILILMAVFWGVDPFDYAIIAALIIEVVMCVGYLYVLNKMLKAMLADSRTSVLSLDETGVELNKGGSQIVKLGWDNIAVVRADKESLTFVSGDRTGIVISAAKKYADEILVWLRENLPSMEVVESQ